jgi:hypothetical protein
MGADARRTADLEAACRAHLEFVRKNCPHLLPDAPLEPGATAPALPLDGKRAGSLVALAARQALSARPADDDLPRAVVWRAGTDALLVLLDTISVRTGEGVVTVAVAVACDELSSDRRTRVEIDFVVGTNERPTGLLAAATPPRGPELIVERWGDALVALAWQALLDSAAGLAAEAGSDLDGAGLLPTSWTASRDGIAIVPQARHPFDRLPPAAVRR